MKIKFYQPWKESKNTFKQFLEYMAKSSLGIERWNRWEPVNKFFSREKIPEITDQCKYESNKDGHHIDLRTSRKIGLSIDYTQNSRNINDLLCGFSRYHSKKHIPVIFDVFFSLFVDLDMEYGFICLNDEKTRRNAIEEPYEIMKGRLYAPQGGNYIDEGYPGLYWLNFFGKKSIKYFGRKRLLSCPAYKIHELANGSIVIQIYEHPEDYNVINLEKGDIHQKAIEHLGPGNFFDRNNKDRELASKGVVTTYTVPPRPHLEGSKLKKKNTKKKKVIRLKP